MKPTIEQENIVQEAITGSNIAISAFAGAAKTTTCLLIAEKVVKPSLYIAFNKSIATEASSKFPEHVLCKTLHSVAYKDIVRFPKSPMGKKLQANLSFSDLDTLISNNNYWYVRDVQEKDSEGNNIIVTKNINLKDFDYDDEVDVKVDIMKIIKKYCQSAYTIVDECIDKEFFDIEPATRDLANDYWDYIISPKTTGTIHHDTYLKLYQLSNPVLPYSVIYLDEAQDSNPVTLDIFYKQKHAQLIMVGDSFQSIYEWRGAVNAMDSIPSSFKHLYLTTSFRFTQRVADIANKITSYIGNSKRIEGKQTGMYDPDSRDSAILCRTNATMLELLLGYAQRDVKTYVIADLNEIWSKVYHINSLINEEKPKYPNYELKQYKNLNELERASRSLPELAKFINLTRRIRREGSVSAVINSIKDILVDSPREAAVTIVTGHKSKGLEWDSIQLAEDFANFNMDGLDENGTYTKDKYSVLRQGQLGNLLYVACTRARYRVQMPEVLEDFLDI